jgi:DNA-binding IclR family transcriptional regulator
MTEDRQSSEREMIRVFDAVRADSKWLTTRDIAMKADMHDGTARRCVARLVCIGVFERAELSGEPQYRIRWSRPPDECYLGLRVDR